LPDGWLTDRLSDAGYLSTYVVAEVIVDSSSSTLVVCIHNNVLASTYFTRTLVQYGHTLAPS